MPRKKAGRATGLVGQVGSIVQGPLPRGPCFAYVEKKHENRSALKMSYREEIRDGTQERKDRAFQNFMRHRIKNGKISTALKDWITVQDGAEWARKQVKEWAEKFRAEHGLPSREDLKEKA